MRPRRLALALALVVVGAGAGWLLAGLADDGPAVAAAETRAVEAAPQRPSAGEAFLFSQSAAGGTLRGRDDRRLVLTLTGVRDWVTRFGDRPARDAQTVDVRDFLARWQARFGSSPPNAVLSYRLPGEPVPRELVLELRNPRYDAAARTATYDARRIRPTADRLPGARHPRPPVVYPLPRTFGAASLFIDDGDTSVDTMVESRYGGYSLSWRADLSQCAGYGSSSTSGTLVYASYHSYSSHSCFFDPTYARFDVYGGDPPYKVGTITFGGDGTLVSCTPKLACQAGNEFNNETIQILGVNG